MSPRHLAIVAAAAFLCAQPGLSDSPRAPAPMTVAQFLAKFTSLRKRGPAEAPARPNRARSRSRAEGGGRPLSRRGTAARAARVDPRSRLPLTGQAGVNASDRVAAWSAPPSDQQAQTVRAAFDRYMDLPFACPA